MVKLFGKHFNLLNVTEVYVGVNPELPEHYHERRWVSSSKIRISTAEDLTGNIYLAGKKSVSPRDKDHEYFYGEIKYHWWGGHTYNKFRWVPERELQELSIWTVIVKLTDNSTIYFRDRTLIGAYNLRDKIIDMVNQIDLRTCKYEPPKSTN